MRTHSSRSARSATAAAAVSAVALLAAGCSGSGDGTGSGTTSDPAGITTEATGTATGTPDTLTVTLGVQTEAPDANAAISDNAEKANAVIGQLKNAGIADADIQTSNLNVHAQHGPDGNVTGYQVTNQVTATVHDISQAGSLIDAAASAAGDAIRVQQTSFSIADDSSLRADARKDAVQQAQAQAKQIAEAAGVGLGGIRSITEVPKQGGAPVQRYDMRAAAGSTPVEPGSQDLDVTVQVVYDID